MGNKFVEHYKELREFKTPTVWGLSRKITLDSLSLLFRLTGRTVDLLQKPRVQFLYIHHIFKDEEPFLRKLIEELSGTHSFISYSEAVSRILAGKIDKPYISISSDDGLKNNRRAAALMAEYGISACFFICPPMIGEKNFEKIKEFSNQRLHLPAVEFMDWQDVEALQQEGHEIGGHTMSHVNLATSSNEELYPEISNCFEEIKKRCGSAEHFAYPYGRYHHFTQAARKVVFFSGFSSCASAERGCHIALKNDLINKEDLFIRRDHIILSWPLEHILFFMARNVQKASVQNNYFSYL
jgi:peptidoglycan/xylan/chitin deacetylase (PgdA/CDA1 family)